MNAWIQSVLQALLHTIQNPLLYWAIGLSFFTVYHIRKEQRQFFGKALYSNLKTWSHNFVFSIITSFIISAIAILFGLVFTKEIIVILSVVTFILTIGYRLQFLSATYILGFTYLLLLPTHLNFFGDQAFYLMFSITTLIGIMLLLEGHHLFHMKTKHLSPEIRVSLRGAKIGRYSFEKLLFVPFFILIPGETIIPFFPVFSFGEGTYTLALIPFIFGFSYRISKDLPQIVTKKLAIRTASLGIIVIMASVLSLAFPVINYGVVAIAIIGHLYIQVSSKIDERSQETAFLDLEKQAKVFWVKRGSIADIAGLQIGDTIIEINNHKVKDVDDVNRILHALPPGTTAFTVENYVKEIRSFVITEPIYNYQDFGIQFIE